MDDRLAYFARLAAEEPQEPRARYAYANELLRAGRWEEAVAELRAYLALAPGDEGSGHGRLAAALRELGRVDEAADAYLAGIEAAERNGHHDLAEEFRQGIESL